MEILEKVPVVRVDLDLLECHKINLMTPQQLFEIGLETETKILFVDIPAQQAELDRKRFVFSRSETALNRLFWFEHGVHIFTAGEKRFS